MVKGGTYGDFLAMVLEKKWLIRDRNSFEWKAFSQEEFYVSGQVTWRSRSDKNYDGNYLHVNLSLCKHSTDEVIQNYESWKGNLGSRVVLTCFFSRTAPCEYTILDNYQVSYKTLSDAQVKKRLGGRIGAVLCSPSKTVSFGGRTALLDSYLVKPFPHHDERENYDRQFEGYCHLPTPTPAAFFIPPSNEALRAHQRHLQEEATQQKIAHQKRAAELRRQAKKTLQPSPQEQPVPANPSSNVPTSSSLEEEGVLIYPTLSAPPSKNANEKQVLIHTTPLNPVVPSSKRKRRSSNDIPNKKIQVPKESIPRTEYVMMSAAQRDAIAQATGYTVYDDFDGTDEILLVVPRKKQ